MYFASLIILLLRTELTFKVWLRQPLNVAETPLQRRPHFHSDSVSPTMLNDGIIMTAVEEISSND